ncbi:hypothetical protein EV361DRAFT_799301 [Lentinula raphanica]|uniref:Uncharacterized protein n=1 Tax=Lentinula raphanica TaxID=153919 RepID=A0AA38PCM9_9AGAR|nr:hypothetical protein F5878DRAFT_533652 [Lentinula raphanica]KAJ3971797.1 hypothetical protein EV361DRAFT_799301 [Lentinula raphanica]
MDLFDPAPSSSTAHRQPHRIENSSDPESAPPAYSATPMESLGDTRVTFQGMPGFPTEFVTGPPPCRDLDGISPVFFGSAHFDDSSVHPCKIAPGLSPSPCRVPYGSKEHHHNGPYTLLPFNPETMELVPTSGGRIPTGRRPIVGGHERDKDVKLYHAVALVSGRSGIVRVPGKTAPHLSGCNFAWGGIERVFQHNYEIL